MCGDLSTKLMCAQQNAMSAPPVVVQSIEVANSSGAQRIKVNIPDQFQQIGLLVTDNGFVAVLKQVAAATMTEIESGGMSGQLQNPEYTGHLFRFQLDTDSGTDWTVFPILNGH